MRFICGTQDLHKTLEARLARFLGTEDAILYAAAFDANGGLFEPLLGEDDAVISDELNHASIIDGIRLCKAQRYRYKHNDMADLERCLQRGRGRRRALQARLHRRRVLDGRHHRPARPDARAVRPLRRAARHRRMPCQRLHGRTGRGTHEHRGVFGKIDIITGTLGKALGGASGGFTAARREVVELLRQRSRPYLFSNTAGAGDRRRVDRGARPARGSHRAARQARRQHALVPRRRSRRPASTSSRASTRSCRSWSTTRSRRSSSRARLLELGIYVGRLLLPGGAQGPGAHPRADERGARARAPRGARWPRSRRPGASWAVK